MTDGSINSFLKDKKRTKSLISKELKISSNKPLLGIFLDHELSEELAVKLKDILSGLKSINLELVLLADTNLEFFEKCPILPYNRKNRKLLLEASDIALVFPFSDVEEMLIHGTIPVSTSRDEVKDYDANREIGNSFVYNDGDQWSMFAALVRAVETFKFPYDWRHIVRQGFESVSQRKHNEKNFN